MYKHPSPTSTPNLPSEADAATEVGAQAVAAAAGERLPGARVRGGVIWLTGLSGAGKSTLAAALEKMLAARGRPAYVLDGDVLRHGLNRDLGFSQSDRNESMRRVGEVAALFADAGVIAIVALISPYAEGRQRAREAANGQFHEVYLQASVDICEGRDPKGLYRQARRGELTQFTGVSAPYQIPEQPDLVIDTGAHDLASCVAQLTRYVDERFPDH